MEVDGAPTPGKGYVVATDSGYIDDYVIDKEIGQVRFTLGELDDALRLLLDDAVHLSCILSDNSFDAWVESA